MKRFIRPTLTLTALGTILCTAKLAAADANDLPLRIGTYDSRAVAYAWFSSPGHMREIHEMVQQAKAAQTAGNTNLFQDLRANLRKMQDQIHREAFSTAPPVEALADIKERLPDILKSGDVIALISKWDDNSLKQYPGVQQIDVTDKLVQEFQPTEKQLKAIESLEKSTPLPLDKCNELIREGKI